MGSVAPPNKIRPASSGSIPVGGFTPGTILSERYRIVGLVGRGGMGEVYRADDLKLAQTVALKFLPKGLSDDPVRRERFFAEVRITRQLSHPNICRVYDIAEFEGQHFLSMEFIDGEDLASLIRRIGHLSNEKALDIARQLTAGLAAAHEKGVLHRDLKPANVMIDGHGRVRITDFGIAIAIGDENQAAEISGTPPYMAPEQLAGKGASVRSDTYALGLILYELCSGKRAFTAATLAELREQKENQTPRSLSDIRTGVDPILERLITRCIDRDPRGRPASVAQLAAALPGGDPLAAAIAAGETPSPEMVAAAGMKEGLRPAMAVALLVFIVLGALLTIPAKKHVLLFERAPVGKSPELLREKARALMEKLGYPDRAPERVWGYSYAFSSQDLMNRGIVGTLDQWKNLEPWSLRFWYRESVKPLVHGTLFYSTVDYDDPPFRKLGEIRLQLSTEGTLREFSALPQQAVPSNPSVPSPASVDWSRLFLEAGLDLTTFSASQKPWKPDFYADAFNTWEGPSPQAADVTIRVEAAAYGGKPVYFRVSGPWSSDDPGDADRRLAALAFSILLVLVLVLIVSAALFVRRNIRLGRGDRRGALRLVTLFLIIDSIYWALTENHTTVLRGEVMLAGTFVGGALTRAAILGLFYLAMEPMIRRRWPESLIPWTRLLSGEWRDPLVGRDVLVGCAAGVLFSALNYLRAMTSQWFGLYSGDLWEVLPLGVLGPGPLLASLIGIFSEVAFALGILIAFFLLKTIFRRSWIANLSITIVLLAVMRSSGAPWYLAVQIPLLVLLFAFLAVRFGLLAMTVCLYVTMRMNMAATTFDTSAWYFWIGLIPMLTMLVLACAAFRISLGGVSLLKDVEE